MTTKQKLTTREAIVQVLAGGKAMKVPAIIEQVVPLTALAGKTPGQTVYTTLYTLSKKQDAPFIQTDRGEFKLAPVKKVAAVKAAKPAAKATTKPKTTRTANATA
jgi:hypothetical protein